MQKASGLRITVLKTIKHEDIFGRRLPEVADDMASVCTRLQEGQTFTVEPDGQMPAGFCTRAWHDIAPDIAALRFGGNFPWMKQKGMTFASCSDGAKPVIFRVERTG